jgi:cyanophycin synthetase
MSKLIYQYYSPTGLKQNKKVTNSSRLVLKAADKYGIKWRIIPGTQVVSLSYQGQTKEYYHQVPSSTTAVAHYACNHKRITSNLLSAAQIKVPKGYRIKKNHSGDYLKETFKDLTKPLVVKPSDGTWGENITVGISNYDKYLEAVKLAASYSSKKNSSIVVEEMFDGIEYRILASNKKVIGILNRIPAHVFGDGKSSIKQLIKEENKNPIRSVKGGATSHLYIRIDQKLKDYLKEQNLSLESVPKLGEQIYLRRVSNVSQGGSAIDVTDLAHPSVKEIAVAAVKAIPGLSWAGVDFMTTDITAPQTKDSYVIIEINDSPGFDIHDYPYKGKKRYAADEFLKLMFPDLKLKY